MRTEEKQSIGDENELVDSESEGEDNVSEPSDSCRWDGRNKEMRKELGRRIKITQEMSGVD